MTLLPRSRWRVVARAWAAALLVLAVWPSGCGPQTKPRGTLGGQVTYKGNPVTVGQIDILSEDRSVGATAPLNGSGRFLVDAPIPAGVYTVCIIPPQPSPESEHKMAALRNVPKKAQDMQTSGLTLTVSEGPNDVVIELKD